MQVAQDVYDEFLATDPKTGERLKLNLAEKEKMYLDCLDEYYNSGKQMLSDEDYEQLKQDLSFEGSRIATFTAQEIKYLIANKRYRLGEPILDDKEYDKLRAELKAAGSVVVLHEAPTCKVDTGECKMDMRIDQAKQRLLYSPGIIVSLVVLCELSYWVLGLDPLMSLLLAAVPSYFFGVWFTENIFAQDPLVVQTACPNCNYLLTAYFGDLFKVQTDGIIGTAAPPGPQIELTCPNCKAALLADREKMIISSIVNEEGAKPKGKAQVAA